MLKKEKPGPAGKLARMGILTAVALTIFLVEAQLPPLVPLPGIKLGLANIVTVYGVFALGPGEAAGILFARIFLGAVFAGNFSSIFYSAGGGLLAILTSIALRRVLRPGQIWVAGCLGAVAHGVGQMGVAVLLSGTPAVLVYLPPITAWSLGAGLFTGLCAQFLVKRGKTLWKTTSN